MQYFNMYVYVATYGHIRELLKQNKKRGKKNQSSNT